MKLLRISLAAFFFALTYSTVFAFDTDRVGKVDVGFQIGAAFVEPTTVDDTLHLGMTLAYGITPDIAVGLEGGWHESSTSANNDESIGIGIILGDIIFRMPTFTFDQNLVPYFLVGLGYATDYITNDGSSANDEGADVSDGGFAYKLGIGFDYFANEHWLINLELAYNATHPEWTGARVSVNDHDYWSLLGGLKYIF